MTKKVKLLYAGRKAHMWQGPAAPEVVETPEGVKDFTRNDMPVHDDKGDSIKQTVKIYFDEDGKGECTEDEWRALAPHAANAGITRVN